MNNLRIICPDSHIPECDRIVSIYNEFDKWISDVSFVKLVSEFGGHFDENMPVKNKIKWLREDFIDIWDYRKQQNEALTKEGEAARWLLKNNQHIIDNKELIYYVSMKLGLAGTESSLFSEADYLLPLGGARMSNLDRCLLAKKEMNRLNHPAIVVALSGMRPISESERNGYIDSYAPNAFTEYDAIVEGMKIAFSPLQLINEQNTNSSNSNMSYNIKQFKNLNDETSQYYTVAAPSTNPKHRANSSDCFKFFFDKFNVPKHAKLINCTSQIYCSYQQIRSLFFAIQHNVVFDTIGHPQIVKYSAATSNKDYLFSEPVNYLQEIKASIDAMYDFIMYYSI